MTNDADLKLQAQVKQQFTQIQDTFENCSSYLEAIDLPFNYSSISGDFIFDKPDDSPPNQDCFWAIIQGNSAVIVDTPSGLELPGGTLPDWLVYYQTPLRIGIWHEKPLYAISICNTMQLQAPFVAEPYNASAERMDIQTLTLSGLARQILHWEQQSRHCPRCGAETERITSSWGKRCGSCKTSHFPHIHPCAIVLVKRDNELLLVRKAEWVPGRYGLVAGFLDFGESLEECAVREVLEETGIEICNVRYVGSQNWPFPAQLMAGFVADYVSGDIAVEVNELEDARWFPVAELPALPPVRSIARWMIDNFKAEN